MAALPYPHSLKLTLPTVCANVSMYKAVSGCERVRENEPYILFQSRWPRLKTFHRHCKGNVNLSLQNLAHTHTHTKAMQRRVGKKASSLLSPLYTHNALKWKTAHTGPGIEGGPNTCFSLPCSVLIANDKIYNNLWLRVQHYFQNP